METFTCYGCRKRMPEQVLKTMTHVSERRALVVLMCPACQQKFGDQNPNYYYTSISSAVVNLEAKKRGVFA